MKSIMITGGAGFIGVNAANYFAGNGWDVEIIDNLSRRGNRENLQWLRTKTPFELHEMDVRDAAGLERVIGAKKPAALLHLAAQVAVTTSVAEPREDFTINALGTFNVLEAVRKTSPETFVVNASTNKVYGKMEDLQVEERAGRYAYRDLATGVGEDRPLDFYSPYGCSKGVADQYALDYARIYNLDTVSFRQSCIYGPNQFGIEDQGWVAWFAIAAVLGRQITIFGDGKQVRDVLHVRDLVRAYEGAIINRASARGQAFNMGGGAGNTLSLLELLSHLQHELRLNIPVQWADWRPGDQHVFVCNLEKAKTLLGWEPSIPVDVGLRELVVWVREHGDVLASVLESTR